MKCLFFLIFSGLKTFGIDLKVALKCLGKKIACGASITGDNELVNQRDFKDNLLGFDPEKWTAEVRFVS